VVTTVSAPPLVKLISLEIGVMYRLRCIRWLTVGLAMALVSDPAVGQNAPPPEDVPAPAPEPPLPAHRAMLGIRVADVNSSAVREYGLVVQQGALITALLRGSPAERAGLPLGGVIVALDGQRIDAPEDMLRVVRAAKPGQEVEVKYYEGARLFRKTIALVPYLGTPSETPTPPPAPAPRGDARSLDVPPPPTPSLAEFSRTVAELQAEVRQLQQEIEQLRKMVSQLVEQQATKPAQAGVTGEEQ
jgi:hypothetical protein